MIIVGESKSKWIIGVIVLPIVLFVLGTLILEDDVQQLRDRFWSRNEPFPPPLAIGDSIQFGDFEWRVLAVYDDNTVLIITEDIISVRHYHYAWWWSLTWEDSTLREWLNNTFFRTFTHNEQQRILPRQVLNNDNIWWGTAGGNVTTDNVFLLSIEEVVRYFGDSGQLGNRSEEQYLINDNYNVVRIAVDASGLAYWWWLRSVGDREHYAAFVDNRGILNVRGDRIYLGMPMGVRPALLIVNCLNTAQIE